MEQEASDELVGVEGHELLPVGERFAVWLLAAVKRLMPTFTQSVLVSASGPFLPLVCLTEDNDKAAKTAIRLTAYDRAKNGSSAGRGVPS